MKTLFKDVAHLYLPYRVYIFGEETFSNGWLSQQIEQHEGLVYNPQVLDTYGISEAAKNGYKPILRPISDITPRERKELWSVVFWYEFNGSTKWIEEKPSSVTATSRWVLSAGVERLGIQMNGEVWADCDLQNYKHNQHLITKLLLGKGFDLFDLIKSREAIDATTQK